MRAPFVFATLLVLLGAAWLFTGESAPPRCAAEPASFDAVATPAQMSAGEAQLETPAPGVRAPVPEEPNRIHVRGRVVDVNGDPVTHGTIEARELEDAPSTLPLPRATSARLDARGFGRFELDLDGPSELTLSTGIPSERTIVSALVQSRAAAAAEYEIVVGSTIRVRGIVSDETGKCLNWLCVRERFPADWIARVAGSDPSRGRWRPPGADVRTDESGEFELCAVAMRGALLEVTYDDEPVETISLPNQDAEGLRFVMPNETVRGVLVRPDGTPIVGATIDDHQDDVLTDAHGRFAFAPGPRVFAEQELRISESGGNSVTFENFGRRWLARDTAVEFRVVFDGLCHQIHGTLLNADGTPAAGWYVVVSKRPVRDIRAENVFHDTYPSGFRTKADGTFALEQLARGSHELYFRSPDENVRFHCADIQSDRSDVVVRVPDDAVIPVLRGRVVTARDEPVPNMQLSFDVANQGGCVIQVGKQRTTTDAEGWFEVRDVSRQATVVGAFTMGTTFVPYDGVPLVVDPSDRTTIRLDARASVEFERRRFDVDGERIVVFDARDQAMPCWAPTQTDRDSALMYESNRLSFELVDERSGRFFVGESAACIAVFSCGGLVARVPVKLDPARENRIVWR